MVAKVNINFDRVFSELLFDMAHAVDGWANGEPRDETALMNRITERLSRNRRKCDVGVHRPVDAIADFYILHRRDLNQSDKFGSDLAATIRIPESDFVKTAFFQLKVSHRYS